MNRLLATAAPTARARGCTRGGTSASRIAGSSIIDLVDRRPADDATSGGNWITYNGEIYNYVELREELGETEFRTTSDTEVILRAYRKLGRDVRRAAPRACSRSRSGTRRSRRLFCARDRFGIKPFYYTIVDGSSICASEAKALLPFLPTIETDLEALKDYLAFQFCLAGKTLFQRRPGAAARPHADRAQRRTCSVERYWEVYYEPDFDHTERTSTTRLRELVEDSVALHLRADVPVGAYVSRRPRLEHRRRRSRRAQVGPDFQAFTGKFAHRRALRREPLRARARRRGAASSCTRSTSTPTTSSSTSARSSTTSTIRSPGPGSFPQYMVSRLAAQHMKVVLGGQGGDEIFGGYARYLIAYFEQCIKAAIDGTMHDGNFVVTYESIIPNLGTLREYKPLMQEFWREGLFEDLDARYFRLDRPRARPRRRDRLGRARRLLAVRDLPQRSSAPTTCGKESYFDSMTHFDFKTLLPALLHVEDRVSMAHGLESRVPFVDHRSSSSRRRMPADVKFKDGQLKHVLKQALRRRAAASRSVDRTRQDGLPGAARRVDEGRAPRVRLATPSGRGLGQRPYLEPRFDPIGRIDHGGEVQPHALGASVARALAAAVP